MKRQQEKIQNKNSQSHSTKSLVNQSPDAAFAKSRCTVCSHDQIEQINQLIAENRQSYRATACQFKLNRMSISRHVTNCLNLSAAKIKTLSREQQKEEFHDMLRGSFIRIEKQLAALDLWLSDPEFPDTYSVAPRADEITVIYLDHKDLVMGEPVRKTALLDDILEEMSKSGRETVKVRSATIDNRKLLLESLAQFTKQMALYAKVIGIEQLPSENEQKVQAAVNGILTFLSKYPDYDMDEVIETFSNARSIDADVLRAKVIEAKESVH